MLYSLNALTSYLGHAGHPSVATLGNDGRHGSIERVDSVWAHHRISFRHRSESVAAAHSARFRPNRPGTWLGTQLSKPRLCFRKKTPPCHFCQLHASRVAGNLGSTRNSSIASKNTAMKTSPTKSAFAALSSLSAVLLFCTAASAQNNQEKGVISGRSGNTMTLQTQDSGNVTVVLNSETQVEEPEGVFRKKHLNMTALVPGLSVDVKGYVNDHNQLVAGTVTFHGSDLQTAQDIQAGFGPHPTGGRPKPSANTGAGEPN